MPNKEEGEKGSCCSGSGHCCCGGKIIRAVILLLIGGIIGYLIGGHCGFHKGACPMTGMTMNAPASMPKK